MDTSNFLRIGSDSSHWRDPDFLRTLSRGGLLDRSAWTAEWNKRERIIRYSLASIQWLSTNIFHITWTSSVLRAGSTSPWVSWTSAESPCCWWRDADHSADTSSQSSQKTRWSSLPCSSEEDPSTSDSPEKTDRYCCYPHRFRSDSAKNPLLREYRAEAIPVL